MADTYSRENNGRQQRKDRRFSASSYYTYGNTAPEEEPYEYPEEESQRSRRQSSEAVRRNHRIRRNVDKALQMNPAFVLFIGMMAVALLAVCINYVRVQSDITTTISDIESAELELEEIRSDNNLLEASIRTYVDLDYVYQVATEELGMVYPDSSQVIYYEKSESEYVRQYDSIP